MRNITQGMSQMLDERIVSKMKFKFLILFIAAVLASLLYPPFVSATSILGTAENFAVLGGTPNITNIGSTTITGDVGIHPGAEITGMGPGANQITLTGAYHVADENVKTAKTDLSNAYTALNNMPATKTLTNAQLGGSTLKSGVYAFGDNPAAVLLNGPLTLDAEFNNNAYWVFQIPNALTTGVSSSVNVIHLGSYGGNDDGVFWVIGSSAGIFASTSFEGNILAYASITLYNSATILNGRALAETGTVTMDTNTISNVCPLGGPGNGGPGYSGGLFYDTPGHIVPIGPSQGPPPVPEPATMLLLGSGLAGLVVFRKRFKKA
jgi:type VI secretion system secreted protein VgrG